MTEPSQSDVHNNNPGDPEGNPVNPDDLAKDPRYAELLMLFQEAKFDQCQQLLKQLKLDYPGHPLLNQFKEELEMKLSVRNLSSNIKSDEIQQQHKATFNLTIFALIATLIILAAFFLSLNYFAGLGAIELLEVPTPMEPGTPQLDQLYNQAEGLLKIGAPGSAAQIIEAIRSINPDHPNLEDLSARTQDLLELEAQYQTGLALVEAGDRAQALEVFRAVQAANPYMWDVSQQISRIETEFQIEAYLQEGQAAYEAGSWAVVINAYERAQRLDARLDDVQKEQLLKAYLNQIIVLLEVNATPIEDIELAESYYRKAMAMIPQSRTFASERFNLQEVSSNLLEVKFTQVAKSLLADKNQTLGSVTQAVSYTRRAANLKPRNTALQQELQNAEYYLVGLRNFVNLNWMGVITNLEPVINADPNYAAGNASYLLFEAYYAVGRQYLNAGLYPDTLRYLQQAEFLVWRDLDNLAKLLQLQTLIGDTFGRMADYENAVSYYQYALNAINTSGVLFPPDLDQQISAAENEAALENYEAAFNAFQEVLQEMDVVYTIQEHEIGNGAILALFAHDNRSTLTLVLRANDLPGDMVIRLEQTLQVPVIEN